MQLITKENFSTAFFNILLSVFLCILCVFDLLSLFNYDFYRGGKSGF